MSKLYHELMKVKGKAEYAIWYWASENYFKVRKVLPLIVNLTANEEECSFLIALGGSIALREGWSRNPDITFRTTLSVLENMISSKDKQDLYKAMQNRKMKIEEHTTRGKYAIQELKVQDD